MTFFITIKNWFSNKLGLQNIENRESVIDRKTLASRKRHYDENLPEVVALKKPKFEPIPFGSVGNLFSISEDSSKMSNQRRLRSTRSYNRKPFGIDFSNTSNIPIKNSNIYSCDGPDGDNSNELADCKVLLQRTEITRGNEVCPSRRINYLSTRQGSFHANKSFATHMCHRSPSCLDRIHQEQDRATLYEMVKKSTGASVHKRKTLPLTTSTAHNTNQNQTVSNNGFNISKGYFLRHSTFSLGGMFPSMKESVNEKTVIDLTCDEDDDSERKIIENNVKNSSKIRNFKSSFPGKDSSVTSPDFITDLLKKYDLRKRNAESRVRKEEKHLQKKNEEFNKSLVEYLEKRLVLKEHDVDEKLTKELAPMTNEMMNEIRKILRSGKEPLVQIKDTGIKVQDIYTLHDCGWLNDEVINAYMNLIKIRSENDQETYPKVHCFNTFFYPQLLSRGYSSVRRWTKKIDVFDYTILVVPIHLGNHWCLAEIRTKEKLIKYYDSFGSPNNRCLEAMLNYLTNEHEDKKGKKFNVSNWQVINVPRNEIPNQKNAYDCGVFACTYAEHITRDARFNFSQEDMSYFREKMTYEILTGKLLL